MFKKFHYMNSEINRSSRNFIGYIEDNPVCFFSVLHFPHPRIKNFKKGHRLVVLPDYQGLGLGHLMSSEIAQMFLDKGFRFIITSSTKALFTQRERDPRWLITRKGRMSGGANTADKALQRTLSTGKLTYSYEYVGNKK
jgi:GNAT superfamily N-acetyltransferase